MASSKSGTHLRRSARLDHRLARHKEEVARLREEFGDPQVALFRFITERFEVQALVPDDRQRQAARRTEWEEDDDDLNAW